jgi:hypothetical protein
MASSSFSKSTTKLIARVIGVRDRAGRAERQ